MPAMVSKARGPGGKDLGLRALEVEGAGIREAKVGCRLVPPILVP